MKLRDWGWNGLALAFSLALIYAGAEAYVAYAVDDGMQFDLEMWRYSREVKRQSANPAIGHEHRPNARAHLMGVDVATNSLGLRDREFEPAPPPGRTRLLMLGDSFTFGWGVPVDKTYAKRLERLLQRGGHDVEVINSGVGNYNTEMQVAYFLERGIHLKPHYVVLNYFVNDAEPTPRYEKSLLARCSRAYVYFASRVDAALCHANVGGRSDWRSYYASLYGPDGLTRVASAIQRLAQGCREHGIKLFIANYPELRIPANYPFAKIDESIERIARANDVRYVSLLPAVRGLEPSSLWVTRADPHPSVAAHEAFARELFRFFDAELRPSTRAGRQGKEDSNGNT
jgi:lysophospholipase L1-like esterase